MASHGPATARARPATAHGAQPRSGRHPSPGRGTNRASARDDSSAAPAVSTDQSGASTSGQPTVAPMSTSSPRKISTAATRRRCGHRTFSADVAVERTPPRRVWPVRMPPTPGAAGPSARAPRRSSSNAVRASRPPAMYSPEPGRAASGPLMPCHADLTSSITAWARSAATAPVGSPASRRSARRTSDSAAAAPSLALTVCRVPSTRQSGAPPVVASSAARAAAWCRSTISSGAALRGGESVMTHPRLGTRRQRTGGVWRHSRPPPRGRGARSRRATAGAAPRCRGHRTCPRR